MVIPTVNNKIMKRLLGLLLCMFVISAFSIIFFNSQIKFESKVTDDKNIHNFRRVFLTVYNKFINITRSDSSQDGNSNKYINNDNSHSKDNEQHTTTYRNPKNTYLPSTYPPQTQQPTEAPTRPPTNPPQTQPPTPAPTRPPTNPPQTQPPQTQPPQAQPSQTQSPQTQSPKDDSLLSIPLRILEIIPSSVSRSDYYLMYEKDPITVVFNRPVIALGTELDEKYSPFHLRCDGSVDVDGNYRWVTTSIVRFDINGTWPTDLRCSFEIDPSLTAFDGAQLSNLPDPVYYKTTSPIINIETVISNRTLQMTNNKWSPFTSAKMANGTWYTSGPEVPPDGIIIIRTSIDFETGMLKSSIKAIRERDSSPIDIDFVTCPDREQPSTRVFCVSFGERLQIGETYSLIFPQGSKLNLNAGPLAKQITIRFNGLYPFVFPFQEQSDRHYSKRLLLRHGLATPSSLQSLRSSFSFVPALNFTLEVIDAATLQITAPFKVLTNYTLIVSPQDSVMDGWGIPLVRHQTTIHQDAGSYYTVTKQDHNEFYEANSVDQIATIYQNVGSINSDPECKGKYMPYTVAGYPLTKYNLVGALNSVTKNRLLVDKPKQIITLDRNTTNTPLVASLNSKDLWKQSGTFLQANLNFYDYNCKPSYSFNFNTETEISISARPIDSKIIVWLTYLENDTNVADATVYAYGFNRTYNPENDVYLLGHRKTNKNGIAYFNHDGERTAFLVVEYGSGRLHPFATNFGYTGYSRSSIKSELIADRKLYNAGEVVHLKGYLKGDRSLLSETIFKISVDWLVSSTMRPFSQKVSIDATYNTFDIDITIPPNTNHDTYSLRLTGTSVNDITQNNYYSSVEILIADPRIPTGKLEISHNASYVQFVEGDISVDIHVATTNYLGVALSSQNVTMTYTYLSNFYGSSHANSSFTAGSVNVITDAAGQSIATARFSAGQILDGDSMSFSAQYLDSTRSLVISKKIELYFLKSEYGFNMRLTSFISNNLAPGVPQGIYADLIHIPTGKLVTNASISLQIAPAKQQKTSNYEDVNMGQYVDSIYQTEPYFDQQDEEPTADSKPIKQVLKRSKISAQNFCQFEATDTDKTPPCAFALPHPGQYIITARSNVASQQVSSTLKVGYEQEYWDNNLFIPNYDLTLYTDKSQYLEGDTPRVTYFNPFKRGRFMVQWGCGDKLTTKQLTISYGIGTFELDIGKKCADSFFHVDIVGHGSRLGYTIPPEIRVSPHISLNSPSSVQGSVGMIATRRPTIDISIDLTASIVKPNTETHFYINLRNVDGSKFNGDAEACIVVVDQRNIDLVPHSLSHGDGLKPEQSFPTLYSNSRNALVARYLTEFKILLNRFKQDLWTESAYWGGFNLNAKDFIYYSWITSSGGYYYPYNHYYPYPTPSEPTFSSGTTTGIDFDAPRAVPQTTNVPKAESARANGESDITSNVRTNFKTTPLFLPKVIVRGGVANVSLKMPDDLTTFAIRAYLITNSSEFVSYETHITSRKDLNILPIQPRFARIGDIFECGVTVVVGDPAASTSNMRLVVKLEDPSLDMLSGSSKLVNIPSDQTSCDVLFNFRAIYKGTSKLIFYLYRGTELLDSTEITFDVLGRQLPIYIGTSMTISSNTTAAEGIRLPLSEPGTGSMDIVVGVGRYPAIEVNCVKLLAVGAERTPSSIDLLSQQVTYGALTSYGYSKTLINQSQEALKQMVDSIDSYIGRYLNYYPDESSNYYPTLYAIVLKNLMEQSNIDGWAVIHTNISDWVNYIDNYLNDQVSQAHRLNRPIDKELIGYASIGLGYYWAPTEDGLDELYSWNALTANITDNCSLLCQSYFVIAALIRGESNLPFINTVIQNIENNIRIQGRTAYVTYGSGSSQSSLVLTTYASIAFIMTNHQTPMLEKMINFIATGGISPTFDFFNYYVGGQSSEQLALSVIAMTYYDKSTHSTRPNLSLLVYQDTPSRPVLSAKFNENNTQSISKTTQFGQLAQNQGKILFQANGTGEISASIGINYVPTTLPDKPIFHGFYVQKIIKVLNSDGNSTAATNNTFQVGQLVQVTISVTTPDDVGVVYIEDGISAGIEPLDNNIYDLTTTGSFDTNYQRFRYWTYRPFSYRETKKDVVIFHGTNIIAGSYTVSYNAVTTIRGKFTLPPTKVYSSKQPEIFGLSDGFLFDVK